MQLNECEFHQLMRPDTSLIEHPKRQPSECSGIAETLHVHHIDKRRQLQAYKRSDGLQHDDPQHCNDAHHYDGGLDDDGQPPDGEIGGGLDDGPQLRLLQRDPRGSGELCYIAVVAVAGDVAGVGVQDLGLSVAVGSIDPAAGVEKCRQVNAEVAMVELVVERSGFVVGLKLGSGPAAVAVDDGDSAVAACAWAKLFGEVHSEI